MAKMFNLSDIELNKLCRTCLSIGEMKSLFEKSANEPDLAEMLMTCTPVEYYSKNGLPEQVCQDCFNEISRSYKFAIKCRQTEDKLQVYLQNLVKLKTSLICDASLFKLVKPDLKNKSEIAPTSNLVHSEGQMSQSATLNMLKINIENVYSLANSLSTSELNGELNQELDICKQEFDESDQNDEDCTNIDKNMNLPSVTTSTDPNDLMVTDSSELDLNRIKTEKIDDEDLINEIIVEIKVENDYSDTSTIDPLDYCYSPELDQNIDNIKSEQVSETINYDTLISRIVDYSYAPTHPLIPFTHTNPVVVLEQLNMNTSVKSPQCEQVEEALNHSGSVVTRHLAERMKNRAYPCPICDKSYFRPYDLKRHIHNHNRDVYSCKVCKKKFNKRGHFLRHVRSHTQVYPTSKATFSNYFELRRHSLVHSKQQNVSCKYCNKTYKTTRSLEVHIQVEHNEKDNEVVRISCQFCNKKFARAHVLEQHISLMHNGFTEVKLPDKILHSKELDKRYQCTICEKDFTKYYINKHILTHTENKRYSCPICKEKFTKSYNLKRHYRSHKIKNKRTVLIYCDYCKQRFSTPCNLRRHLQNSCRNKPELSVNNSELSTSAVKQYSCKVCNLYYYKESQLNKHMLIHVDEESMSCKICYREYLHRILLMNHMVMHMSNQKYTCTVCKKVFKSKYHLQDHAFVHIPTGLFPCEMCSLVFNRPRSLQDHKYKKHGNRRRDNNQNQATDDCRSENHSNTNEVYELRKRSPVKTSYVDDPNDDSDSTMNTQPTNTQSNHQIATLNIDNLDKTSTSKPTVMAKRKRCNICKKTFKLQKYLRSHMRHVHIGRQYSCLICHAVFNSIHYLKCHKRQHHFNQLANTNNELNPKEESKTKSLEYAQSELSTVKNLENFQLNNENSQNMLSNDNSNTFSTSDSQSEPSKSKDIQFDNKITQSQLINNHSKWRREQSTTEPFISELSKPNLIAQRDSNNIKNYQSANEIPNIDSKSAKSRKELIDTEYRNAQPQNYKSDYENCENEISSNGGTEYENERNTDNESSMSGDFQNHGSNNKLLTIDKQYKLLQSMDYQNHRLDTENDCHTEISNDQSDNGDHKNDQCDIIDAISVSEVSKSKGNQNQGLDKSYEPPSNEDYKKYGLRKRARQKQSYIEVSDEEIGELRKTKRKELVIKETIPIVSSKILYSCSVCTERFINEVIAKQHVDSHGYKDKSTGVRYNCEICEHPFQKLADLEAHIPVHRGRHPFTCSYCDMRFARLSILKVHMQTHDDDRKHACSFCDRRFKRRDTLRKHEVRHTSSHRYTCEICDKYYLDPRALRAHMLTHTNKKIVSCSICKKTFTRPALLQYHMRTHNGYKYPCVICKLELTSVYRHREHMITHSGITFDCSLCHKTFKSPEGLKTHQQNHAAKIFKCTLCDNGYKIEQSLLTHMRKMHS